MSEVQTLDFKKLGEDYIDNLNEIYTIIQNSKKRNLEGSQLKIPAKL